MLVALKKIKIYMTQLSNAEKRIDDFSSKKTEEAKVTRRSRVNSDSTCWT